MKILVACEESQAVCTAFRERGHEAYSCDIIECSGGHPEWHIQQSVTPLLNGKCSFKTCDGAKHTVEGKWDMIIAFPPCTYLTVTGNRWFDVVKYGYDAQKRWDDRCIAICFFLSFALADCEKVVIENPIGCMNRLYRKPDQIIHPWMFGDNYSKSTCLWIKGLNPLVPIVNEQPDLDWFEWFDEKAGRKKRQPQWYADAFLLPPKERAKVRSKTFPGIAKAMAEQWG